MINIKYQKIKRHYKYKLYKTARLQTKIKGFRVRQPFIELFKGGMFVVYKEYAWNGADNPAWDTQNIMAGSLFHDAGCQLVENGLLPLSCIPALNELMIDICKSKNMSKFRAKRVLWGIENFCNPHYTTRELKIYEA